MTVTNEIQQLKDELRVAQELLFLVLDHIGEPVVLDIATSREKIMADKAIDLQLDKATERWVLQVVNINEQL